MSLSRRAFIILIASVIAAVVAVACSSSNTNPVVPSCSFNVVQPATTFTAAGGSAAVAVTAGSGCTWTATSSASFVAITAGQSGSGNGTVQFTVAANTGASRSATLTVAGTTLAINQAGTTSSTGTLSAPSANSPSEGALLDPGRPTLVVNNAAATGSVGTVTYRFEISDLPTFPADPTRNFSQDGVAQGNGTTSWAVTQNLGPSVRWYWHARAVGTSADASAYSSVATFNTRALDILCTYALINPSNGSAQQQAPPAGGGFNANLTASPAGCAWSLAVEQSSAPSMLSISSATTGTGNTTMGFGVTPLPSGTTSRRGTIRVQTTVPGRVGSAIYTVVQQ
jgi:all-beta uncharacterized protein